MRFLLLLLLLSARAALAVAQSSEVSNLRGLSAYSVTVQFDMSGFLYADTSDIRTSVELELRRAGVRVLRRDSSDVRIGLMAIVLNCMPIHGGDDHDTIGHVCVAQGTIRRWLTTVDKAPRSIHASVYTSTRYNTGPDAGQVTESLRPMVAAIAREFANAALAAK